VASTPGGITFAIMMNEGITVNALSIMEITPCGPNIMYATMSGIPTIKLSLKATHVNIVA
jgi:hypothetical protein